MAALSPQPRWPWLDPFADAVNPAVGLVLLVITAHAARQRRWREAIGLPLTLGVMLGVAYGLAYFDRVFGAFALFGLDFSTHGAVHLAAGAALLVWQPRRWPWVLGIALGYHALMAAQGYHTAVDLLGTAAAVTLPISLLATALRPVTRARADSAVPRHNSAD